MLLLGEFTKEQYWPVESMQLHDVATNSMSTDGRILLTFPKIVLPGPSFKAGSRCLWTPLHQQIVVTACCVRVLARMNPCCSNGSRDPFRNNSRWQHVSQWRHRHFIGSCFCNRLSRYGRMVGCNNAGVRLASLSVIMKRQLDGVSVRLPNLNISVSFRTVALNRLIGTLD